MLWATSSETEQQETVGPARVYTDHNPAECTTNYNQYWDLHCPQTPGHEDSYVRMLLTDFSWAVNTIIPQQLISKLDQQELNTLLTGRPRAARVGGYTSSTITLTSGTAHSACFSKHQLCCCGEQHWVPRKACHWGPPLDRQHLTAGQENSLASHLSPQAERSQSVSPHRELTLHRNHGEHSNQLHRCAVRRLHRILPQDPPSHSEGSWDHRCNPSPHSSWHSQRPPHPQSPLHCGWCQPASQPLHRLFGLLPSRRRLQSLQARTSWPNHPPGCQGAEHQLSLCFDLYFYTKCLL